MHRRMIAAVLAAGALCVAAPAPGPAAGPAVTETTAVHRAVETFVDVLPTCEEGGSLYTTTLTYSQVLHTTTSEDGGFHEASTQTGTFVAGPVDAGLESFTGRFTIRSGFHQNDRTVGGTSTVGVRGTGSDGSTLRNHVQAHFNERPDGTARRFFRCS